ncbi:hypothetical protein GCM10022251_79730 [Phytohabitans flavus]|uniref:Uncharacterized protein n=1 Tax=Phytohabitans flavus TaxID=1076124 RepID=A0A6F8Y456_9ACTN|nr:hypothetical protein [Phytohabitans flavus]BCB80896.1 hypothetical protein Pflav_073060 [Phytohabitans flavus]
MTISPNAEVSRSLTVAAHRIAAYADEHDIPIARPNAARPVSG